MIYKIWISLEHQAENKDHSELDVPKLLGVFDTQARAEKFFKLIVSFCDSFGNGIGATGTPPNSQHDHEPDKVKPLAQYLLEYVDCEVERSARDPLYVHPYNSPLELLEQALDAYESTENVTIKIERV